MTNLKNSRLTKKNGQEGPPKALKSRKNRKTNKDFSCYVKSEYLKYRKSKNKKIK